MAAEFYSPADQLIYKDNQFIPQEEYRLNQYNVPTDEEENELTTSTGVGIPYTNAFTGGGGNNYTGSAQNLIGDFGTAITDRQAKINEMNRPMRPANEGYSEPGRGVFTPAEQPSFKRRISDAFYSIPGINRPQSYEDIMTEGYQEPGGVMPGIIGLMNKFGIQNFASLPQKDQAFIKSQTGYTGPTVFGELGSNMGHSIDPFGKNVESMFGNYAEGVRKDYDKLSTNLSGKIATKYGVTFDPFTGEITGDADDVANFKQMNRMNLTRFNFRKNQINEQKNIADQITKIQEPPDHIKTNVKPGPYDISAHDTSGPTQRSIRRERADKSGLGHRGGFTDPGKDSYGPHMAQGGRVPFFYGGLATVL